MGSGTYWGTFYCNFLEVVYLAGESFGDDAIGRNEAVTERRLAVVHVRQDADVADALGRVLQRTQQLRRRAC